MTRPLFSIAFVIAMLVTLPKSHAAMIFDNGLPLGSGITFSDSDPSGVVAYAADDFTLATASTLESIWFWGAYALSNTAPLSTNDDFTLRIYSDTAGTIGTVLHTVVLGPPTSRSPAGTPAIFTEYKYDISFASINLVAGTYWLGITNNTVLDTDDNWGWSVSNPNGNRFVSSMSPIVGPWTNEEAPEQAFQLFGTVSNTIVPVPATLVLGLLALPVILLRRRR